MAYNQGYPPQQQGYPPQQQGGYPPQPSAPPGYPPQQYQQGAQQNQGVAPSYHQMMGQTPNNNHAARRSVDTNDTKLNDQFCTKIKLRISCADLISLDVMSKSDPFVILSIGGPGKWFEFGRTEYIKNDSNPNFSTTILIDYFFEEKQHVKFDVYDCDSRNHELNVHDYIGGVSTTLGTIVGAASGQFSMPLKFDSVDVPQRKSFSLKAPNKKRGILKVIADEQGANNKGTVKLEFRGEHLDKKDFFGKSDPYFEIWRQDANHPVLVHRSETILKTLNPSWKRFEMCTGDFWGDGTRPVEIKVYDWDSDGKSDFIGSTIVNFSTETKKEFDLINPKKMPGGKKHKKNYVNSGVLKVVRFEIVEHKSFLTYLKEGLHLNFAVAVDFTGSNGNPTAPSSLHYCNPYAPNQYQAAIQAVGEIIEDYDTTKTFPTFGYGAKVNGVANHCFSLNGQPDPTVQGIGGIMQAYANAIQAYPLWGPTNFAPVITRARQMATQDPYHYYCLLIITDGIITDQQQTISAIVEASRHNISIIIVGVGPADFSQMEELDGDDIHLIDPVTRSKAQRDIVQFVPFRQFVVNGVTNNQALAREVLGELPTQVEEYMRLNPRAQSQA